LKDVIRFVERERKLDVDAAFVVPGVQALRQRGFLATVRQPMVLAATYFDTEDLTLFHAGIAIRRRTGGHDAGWHLQAYDGEPGKRTELQLPLSRGDGVVPSEITRQLPKSLPQKLDLRPVLRLRTERTTIELCDHSGASVGEFADDRVVATRLIDGRAAHWRELEIEAKGGNAETLVQLETFLLASGARPSSHNSKLARGLDLGSEPARSLAGGQRLDALSLRLRAQFVELVAREADVREQRAGGVHQMRIAVRRLRSCLRTFRPAFEEAAVRRVERQLKWLGDLLGAERDAEVFAGRMQRDLAELPVTDLIGSVELDLSARIRDEAVALHARLVQALDSELYRSLLEELVAFEPDPSSRLAADQRWLRQRLARAARRTTRLIKRANALTGTARDDALHEARKSAKHVRYAAETLVAIEGKRASALAARFEALQSVLGEHHDAIVTQHRLRAEGARAAAHPGESGFTYGVLFALEARRAITANSKVASSANRALREAKRWLRT
jgi:CHAD domain-containing protein